MFKKMLVFSFILALPLLIARCDWGSTCSCEAGCDNQITISADFVQNDIGEYCFVSTSLGTYTNNWNLEALTINGNDYTGKYVFVKDITPTNSDGKYYIYYKSTKPWGHFEAKK